jgi:cytochrome c nitrite reductase small subunit
MSARTTGAGAAALVIGAAIGVAGFTFVYAEGASYLTDDPAACANCHVMRNELEGWRRSSHHAVAVCNDCHTPPGFFAKYQTKALNGWHHSVAFTFGGFHEPIRIGARNRAIAERACHGCHQEIVAAIEGGGAIECVRCHPAVGHL